MKRKHPQKGHSPEIWQRAGAVLTELGESFQILQGFPLKPLAIGSGTVIIAACREKGLVFTDEEINLAIARHVVTADYLRSLANGGPRYRIDGETDAEVTPAEREYARVLLDRRRRKREMTRQSGGSATKNKSVAGAGGITAVTEGTGGTTDVTDPVEPTVL